MLARIPQSEPQFKSLAGERTKSVRNLTRTRYDDLVGLSLLEEGRVDHAEPMVFSVNPAANYLEVLACLRNRTGSLGSVPTNGGITLPGARETVPQLGG